MKIYAISISPMILMLVEMISNIPNKKIKSVTYADDLSVAVGYISVIEILSYNLMKLAPSFGYYEHRSKWWLIAKENCGIKTRTMFSNKNVHIY